MSIHVTVNADPVCMRRSKLTLSDLEQIKKYERVRRRRLRLEQVREQSKNIASKILEQTKNIARKELNNLENGETSKLKQMHEQKIMDIQRRYQEDMEDIGMAHESALAQPDSDAILNVQKLKNQITAHERGKEAAKRMKESAKNDNDNDEIVKQQERLRQVREIEDIRSTMVANLPKKVTTKNPKINEPFTTSSNPPTQTFVTDNVGGKITKIHPQQSPKKRKIKKIRGKISPNKLSKQKNTTVNKSKKLTSPQIHIDVNHQEDINEMINPSEVEHTSVPCNSKCYKKSDVDHQNIPTTQLSSNKSEKSSRYNPNDYKNKVLCSNNDINSSMSSLISDDSSYFSDRSNATPTAIISDNISSHKKYPSTANSEIQVYDHTTRQRNAYNHPHGLVERENIQCIPNANEMARQITEMERNLSNSIDNQRLIAQKRGNDALLRDKIRRDYQNLMKNLDHLSREEQKLKATRQIDHSKICNNYVDKNRRKSLYNARQKKMEDAFENIEYNNDDTDCEAIITNDDTCKLQSTEKCNNSKCKSQSANANDELSREEQILDMLKKVERQKRLLLQEFGATLPHDIFNASMTPLFLDNNQEKKICPDNCPNGKKTPVSPEIKVIDMSMCTEKKLTKGKKKSKKPPPPSSSSSPPLPPPPPPPPSVPSARRPNITSTLSSTSEIAVQTQIKNDSDKSIQVELSPDQNKSKTNNDELQLKKCECIEPVVTIITHNGGNVTSSNSSDRGIVINVSRGKVEVTPRKSKKRIKTRSLPTSKSGSPVKCLPIRSESSISAPASRAETPEQNYPDPTDESSSTNSDSIVDNNLKTSSHVNTISTQYSRVTEVSIGTDNSINAPSTIDSSHNTSNNQRYIPLKRRIKYREVSDTSTSYASLPTPNIQRINDDKIMSNITSILELVDSSANETINRMRANISPVSTPETPSPRTMRIPSNLPNIDRITRILTFNDQVQYKQRDNTHEKNQNLNQRRVLDKIPTYQHENHDIYSYGGSNYREYYQHESDNRQSNDEHTCVEKIESLNAQIAQIRDEKKGMECSIIAPSDDTSLMQMPSPKLTPGNHIQGLQDLAQKIETIHDDLTKVFTESYNKLATRHLQTQDILSSDVNEMGQPVVNNNTSGKPQVISNERVHLNLHCIQQAPIDSHTSTSTQIYQNDKNIVEKLSLEILEQSKSVEKSVGNKETLTDIISEKSENLNEKELTKTTGFAPMLADIPRIPNKLSGASTDNGQYRSETKFGRPELSTIDELDTTDTANRSFININRSPVKTQSSPSKRQFYHKQMPTNADNSTNSFKYSSVNTEKNDKQSSPLSTTNENQEKFTQDLINSERTGEVLPTVKFVKSPDSFLTHYSAKNIGGGDYFDQMNLKNEISTYEAGIKCEKIASSSSSSVSGISDLSKLLTSSSSDKSPSAHKEIELLLKELGLSSFIPMAKKTRKASALSSSSNSDTTVTINKRTKSSMKKLHDGNSWSCIDFSDVSSISIREESKSTEKTVLMKARTSTPNIPNVYRTSEKSNLSETSTTSGGKTFHDYSDSLRSKILTIH